MSAGLAIILNSLHPPDWHSLDALLMREVQQDRLIPGIRKLVSVRIGI